MNLQSKLDVLDTLAGNIEKLRAAVLVVDAVDNPPCQSDLQAAVDTLWSHLPLADLAEFTEKNPSAVGDTARQIIDALNSATESFLSGNHTALQVTVYDETGTDINGNSNSVMTITVALEHTALLLSTTLSEIRDNNEWRMESSMAYDAHKFLLNGTPVPETLSEFLVEWLEDVAKKYTSGYRTFPTFHTEQDIKDARALIAKADLLFSSELAR